MTVNVRDVAKRAMDETPQMPLPRGERLIVEGARDFCRRARAWKWRPATIDLVADQADYDITAGQPAESVIDDVVLVEINDVPINPQSAQATYRNPDRIISYHRQKETLLTLVQAPKVGLEAAMVVELNLIPALDAVTLPDILYNEHFEALEQYLKWKAMTRPNTDWSNPEMGLWHGQQYDLLAERARVHVRAGNMTPRHRTRPNDFG